MNIKDDEVGEKSLELKELAFNIQPSANFFEKNRLQQGYQNIKWILYWVEHLGKQPINPKNYANAILIERPCAFY